MPSIVVPSIAATSPHVSDASIQPFLQDDFDPADYLNNALPSLAASNTPRSTQNLQTGRSVPLSDLTNQLQSLLSQLNAQTSRLSNTLTQLTDEIIRSGGRLAYEVEVLRGDTGTLTDVLANGLKDDIELFAPAKSTDDRDDAVDAVKVKTNREPPASTTQPPYLDQLQDLTKIRARLDNVIRVFGDAMAWPLAPSELSLTSSLISISGPDSSANNHTLEEKGRQYAEKIRREITDLLGTGSDVSGIETAITKVENLRLLAEVWKGTAEEKARFRFVDSLQKLVDERSKASGRPSGDVRKPGISPARAVDYRYGNLDAGRGQSEGGYGFLQNLQNIKNNIYLE
ncbi:Hypothetical protein R9X50_00304800 [Acrodontium crateriforme]|uniref:Uncharacterized protein n=1 Tax=Acrodontium crateriforme TaxID=150365 RepID=A0AAQ3R9K6_9PEZI|nr:Hypothetical protein R9X50_00304800 [Acrodontium crateriforme]